MGVRVHWPLAAKIVAALAAAVAALQVLPGLLTPPDPAPLPPDVGLIGVTAPLPKKLPQPNPDRARAHRREPPRTHAAVSREPPRRPPGSTDTERGLGRVAAGAGVLRIAKPSEGDARPHSPHHPSARGRSKRKRSPQPGRQAPLATPSVPEPVATPPPPAPAPPPEPAPEPPPPPPAPPDDGSIEFAPR